MKRLIVYDLDGTLADTLEDIAASANHMLRELGSPGMAAREIRRYVGRGVHELIRGCLKTEDRARIEQATKVYRAHYGRHLLDHTRLYPGARETLERFKDRPQAVVTNKPNPYSRHILEALGVARYFIEIVAGDSGQPKKPDPSAVLALMRQTQARPGETVLVGDSPIDVETARAAGVASVSMTHGLSDEEELRAAGAEALVGSFDELLALATRERW